MARILPILMGALMAGPGAADALGCEEGAAPQAGPPPSPLDRLLSLESHSMHQARMAREAKQIAGPTLLQDEGVRLELQRRLLEGPQEDIAALLTLVERLRWRGVEATLETLSADARRSIDTRLQALRTLAILAPDRPRLADHAAELLRKALQSDDTIAQVRALDLLSLLPPKPAGDLMTEALATARRRESTAEEARPSSQEQIYYAGAVRNHAEHLADMLGQLPRPTPASEPTPAFVRRALDALIDRGSHPFRQHALHQALRRDASRDEAIRQSLAFLETQTDRRIRGILLRVLDQLEHPLDDAQLADLEAFLPAGP